MKESNSMQLRYIVTKISNQTILPGHIFTAPNYGLKGYIQCLFYPSYNIEGMTWLYKDIKKET